MIILGLTGSIGMGKSTAARALRRLGVAVHDADLAVRALMERGGRGVAPVAAAFPGAGQAGAIDRAVLWRAVHDDPRALARLESILHPLARRSANAFLRTAARRRARVVALDVPLLFETGGDARVDRVVVVSAPAFLQRQRVLRRPGMTAAKLAALLARQMPDRDKRRRADIVIRSAGGKGRVLVALAHVLRGLRRVRGRAWRPGYAN